MMAKSNKTWVASVQHFAHLILQLHAVSDHQQRLINIFLPLQKNHKGEAQVSQKNQQSPSFSRGFISQCLLQESKLKDDYYLRVVVIYLLFLFFISKLDGLTVAKNVLHGL